MCIMLLEEFGANVNRITLMGGDTPLHLAALNSHRQVDDGLVVGGWCVCVHDGDEGVVEVEGGGEWWGAV